MIFRLDEAFFKIAENSDNKENEEQSLIEYIKNEDPKNIGAFLLNEKDIWKNLEKFSMTNTIKTCFEKLDNKSKKEFLCKKKVLGYFLNKNRIDDWNLILKSNVELIDFFIENKSFQIQLFDLLKEPEAFRSVILFLSFVSQEKLEGQLALFFDHTSPYANPYHKYLTLLQKELNTLTQPVSESAIESINKHIFDLNNLYYENMFSLLSCSDDMLFKDPFVSPIDYVLDYFQKFSQPSVEVDRYKDFLKGRKSVDLIIYLAKYLKSHLSSSVEHYAFFIVTVFDSYLNSKPNEDRISFHTTYDLKQLYSEIKAKIASVDLFVKPILREDRIRRIQTMISYIQEKLRPSLQNFIVEYHNSPYLNDEERTVAKYCKFSLDNREFSKGDGFCILKYYNPKSVRLLFELDRKLVQLPDKQFAYLLWSCLYNGLNPFYQKFYEILNNYPNNQNDHHRDSALKGGIIFYNGESLITADFSRVMFCALVYKPNQEEILKAVHLNYHEKQSNLPSAPVINVNKIRDITREIESDCLIRIFAIHNFPDGVKQEGKTQKEYLQEELKDIGENENKSPVIFVKELERDKPFMTGVMEENEIYTVSDFREILELFVNNVVGTQPYDKGDIDRNKKAYLHDNLHIENLSEIQLCKVIKKEDITYEKNEKGEKEKFCSHDDIALACYRGKPVVVKTLTSFSSGDHYFTKKMLHKVQSKAPNIFTSTFHAINVAKKGGNNVHYIKGPNIVSVEGLIKDIKGRITKIVLDRYSLTLSEMLKNKKDFTMIERLNIAYQIIKAVIVCHKDNLKLETNLLPPNIWTKEVDGKCHAALCLKFYWEQKDDDIVQATNKSCRNRETNFRYFSPEILNGMPDQVSKCSDIYIFGSVLYELLTKKKPYEGITIFTTGASFMGGVINDGVRPVVPENILDELNTLEIRDEIVNLLKDCWHTNPQARPTAEQIKDKLKKYLKIALKKNDLIEDEKVIKSKFFEAIKNNDIQAVKNSLENHGDFLYSNLGDSAVGYALDKRREACVQIIYDWIKLRITQVHVKSTKKVMNRPTIFHNQPATDPISRDNGNKRRKHQL